MLNSNTTVVHAVLPDLNWSISSSGMFYANVDLGFTAKEILAVSIEEWSGLRSTDVIIPYIRTAKDSIGIMASDHYFDVPGSWIYVKVLYK